MRCSTPVILPRYIKEKTVHSGKHVGYGEISYFGDGTIIHHYENQYNVISENIFELPQDPTQQVFGIYPQNSMPFCRDIVHPCSMMPNAYKSEIEHSLDVHQLVNR